MYIDSYQGYEYYITLLGSHPCAYIVLGEGEDLFDKSVDELEQLPAHGCANYVSTICLIGWLVNGLLTGINFIIVIMIVSMEKWKLCWIIILKNGQQRKCVIK